MEKKKKLLILVILLIVSGMTVSLLLVFLGPGGEQPYIGQRKALIVCSANDFYGEEPDGQFNEKHDSHLNNIIKGTGNWSHSNILNSYGEYDPFNQSLSMLSVLGGPTIGTYSLNFSEHYLLSNYAYYNMTTDIYIRNPTVHPIGSQGVQIGLMWLDSGRNIIRKDWSNNENSKFNEWFTLNITGVCNNETGNEITDLTLVLKMNVSDFIPLIDIVLFDNIKIYKWVLVDLDHPTDPDPPPSGSGINSDGFPAQALQVYWILKDHGYTDDNIFLMLYYKNDADGIIDISIFDSYANDLIHDGNPAEIDVKDDDVNATRFKQELNVSHSGSFASEIHPKDYLIIYMVDHGSNKILTDGNATFHFEADNSFITEHEFYDLVKEINCQRMMINVDCCFSGNFLNANANVGASWYDIDNCIFVSASANSLAWYYIGNKNADGFAGSWFFHIFWDVLDHNGTISDAYNVAFGWVPAARGIPLFAIQNPLMYDNMGINTTLSFNSDPPL